MNFIIIVLKKLAEKKVSLTRAVFMCLTSSIYAVRIFAAAAKFKWLACAHVCSSAGGGIAGVA